jgi:hypothetical protein
VSTSGVGRPRAVVAWVLLGALATVGAACASSSSAGTATSTPAGSIRTTEGPAAPTLAVPKTTPSQDNEYLGDVAKANPALATYVQKQGNVALRAMLTDGAAFCAFLRRGGGIDNALVAVAVGAKSVESQTQLPESVATFNSIEAVALLTLCPSDQTLVPASVRTKVHHLGQELDSQQRATGGT